MVLHFNWRGETCHRMRMRGWKTRASVVSALPGVQAINHIGETRGWVYAKDMSGMGDVPIWRGRKPRGWVSMCIPCSVRVRDIRIRVRTFSLKGWRTDTVSRRYGGDEGNRVGRAWQRWQPWGGKYFLKIHLHVFPRQSFWTFYLSTTYLVQHFAKELKFFFFERMTTKAKENHSLKAKRWETFFVCLSKLNPTLKFCQAYNILSCSVHIMSPLQTIINCHDFMEIGFL